MSFCFFLKLSKLSFKYLLDWSMVLSDVPPPSRKATPLFSLELMGPLLSKANPSQAHRSGLRNHLGPAICVTTFPNLGLGYV